MEIEFLYCPTCARPNLAEAPPCADGHDDCPDRACVECGTALVLDAGLHAAAAVDMIPSRTVASLRRAG